MRHSFGKGTIPMLLAVMSLAVMVGRNGLVAADKLPAKPDAKPPVKAEAKPDPKAPAKPDAKPSAKHSKPAAIVDDPSITDPIEIAIRKGVAYLYSQQKEDNWEIVPRRTEEEGYKVDGAQWGGLTAITTYGLLAAGESPQHPPVAKAINWLVKSDIIGTYAMAMKLQIYNYIERLSPAQKDSLRKDAVLLMNAVKPNGASAGLYHYWLDPVKGDYDQSCSNYGVLGMWAATQQNLEVPMGYWELVDKAWRKTQQQDGGWKYVAKSSDRPETMSMTGAGVATLFITQDMVSEGRGGECKGNIQDKDIDRGMKWLADHYQELFANGTDLYAMYNIERVGTASGYKYFGTVDWYKHGAAHLVKTQQPDGSWTGGHGGPLPGTVWAILFLVKGRAPILVNKLEYAMDAKGVVADWNQRPRDVANLTHWASKQLEKELSFQIVNLKVNADDLHDAPVLYLAGNQNLNLSKGDKEKLKDYVEQGGMILGHADCNDVKFSNSFAKLAQELFPDYEFRDLPSDHLIYIEHFNGKAWTNKPPLKGISNGARELMVLIPTGDPARYWQIRNFASVQTRQLAELATNILLYAMDKTTLKNKFKGQTFIVKRDDRVKATQSVNVARIEYSGNWNPEPAGWKRLGNLLHNTRGVDLDVQKVKLGQGKLADFKLAHLTGTGRFKLSEAERKELKEFTEKGGTLVVDAAGGSAEFKDSAEQELTAIFGSDAKSLSTPLPPENRVYSLEGDKLSHASYRQYARRLLVSGMSTPRLRGMEKDNRIAVYYSPEDLSVGLVGMSIDGIYGYEPEYATELMENIVLIAKGGAIPPKLAPAPPKEEAAPPPPPKEKGEMKPEDKKKPEEKKAPEKKPEKKPK